MLLLNPSTGLSVVLCSVNEVPAALPGGRGWIGLNKPRGRPLLDLVLVFGGGKPLGWNAPGRCVFLGLVPGCGGGRPIGRALESGGSNADGDEEIITGLSSDFFIGSDAAVLRGLAVTVVGGLEPLGAIGRIVSTGAGVASLVRVGTTSLVSSSFSCECVASVVSLIGEFFWVGARDATLGCFQGK
jgi:hypothetical protein